MCVELAFGTDYVLKHSAFIIFKKYIFVASFIFV